MRLFEIAVFTYTLLMVAVHGVTSAALPRLLGRTPEERRQSAVQRTLRFEAAYYVVLFIYIALARRMELLIPATILGAVHLAAWGVAERRLGSALSTGRAFPSLIQAVRIFDALEAVALLWIAWLLAR